MNIARASLWTCYGEMPFRPRLFLLLWTMRGMAWAIPSPIVFLSRRVHQFNPAWFKVFFFLSGPSLIDFVGMWCMCHLTNLVVCSRDEQKKEYLTSGRQKSQVDQGNVVLVMLVLVMVHAWRRTWSTLCIVAFVMDCTCRWRDRKAS